VRTSAVCLARARGSKLLRSNGQTITVFMDSSPEELGLFCVPWRCPWRATDAEAQAAAQLAVLFIYEQAVVCLFNRKTVDASRGRTFHCKMANNG